MLRHPFFRGDPQHRGTKSEVVPNKGEQIQKWLPHPSLLGHPKEGNKIRSGYLTPAFSGARKRAEMLRHSCHSRGSPTKGSKIRSGPQQRGTKSEMATSPCLLGGPKEGGNATPPLHSRGYSMPSAGSKIKSGPQQRGTKLEVAASPLPSRGPGRGRKCYVTPAILGDPQQRGAKSKMVPNKGEQN